MKKHIHRKFNVCAELCPASSVALMGVGVITAAMGALPVGTAVAFTGIAVGLIAPLAKTFGERKSVAKH